MNRISEKLLRSVKAFLDWWLGELWALIPAPVRNRLKVRRSAFVIALGENEAILIRESGRQQTTLTDINLSLPPDANRTHLNAVLKTHSAASGRRNKPHVRIRLASERALRTSTTLPIVAEQNLGEVVGFELDRRTPFRLKDVYFSYRVEGRDNDAQTLRVGLTVVPRRAVEQALSTIGAYGLEVDGVEVARSDDPAAPDELLLGWNGIHKPNRTVRTARAAILTIFLTLAVSVYASSQGSMNDLVVLETQVNEARLRAKRTQDIKESIVYIENGKPSIEGIGRLKANEWLAELTHLLPDDTWLIKLQLSSKKIVLLGYASSSSNIIKLLEESSLFSSPTFVSPVTQDSSTGKDEFTINAVIRSAD